VLWHGAGDSFCAGNDIEDFLKNPPGPGESPQAGLMRAFVNFDKPVVVAVQGAAIGGGTPEAGSGCSEAAGGADKHTRR
jgi:enoyl-CoA hydratase/carnithine racemase